MLFAALMSIKKPGVAFALILSLFGIEQFLQTRSEFFISNGQSVNLSVAVVVGIATVFAVSRNSSLLTRPNIVHVLSILLFGYAFFSYLWTPSQDAFRGRWLKSLPYLVLFFVLGPVISQEKNAIRDGLRWTMYLGVPLICLLYTSPSPRDQRGSRMPSSA